MTLTKRENKLLHIFITFLLFALILTSLFLPENQRRLELTEDKKRVEAEAEEIQIMLADTRLEEDLKQQQELAKDNYDYFYSQLNSYTIDTIVNQLIQKNGLNINTLQIGPYEDALYDFPLTDGGEGTEESGTADMAEAVPETEQAQADSLLVKSTIDIAMSGSYADMLQFMEDLNATSTCLRMDMISIQDNQLDATGMKGTMAVFRIYIYGVKVSPAGMEELTQTSASE